MTMVQPAHGGLQEGWVVLGDSLEEPWAFCSVCQHSLWKQPQGPQPREGKQSKEEENGEAMWSQQFSEVTGD